MDRFSELVSKGVAAFNYTPVVSPTSCCPVCAKYNNIFSIATDTHMSTLEDGTHVITGSIIKNKQKFDHFLYSSVFAGVNFTNAGYYSASDFFNKQGLVGQYSVINNDEVYILKPRSEEEIKKLANVGTYTTSESIIPISTVFLTTENRPADMIECVKDDIYDTAKAMNESRYIKGNNWHVAYLSNGAHIVGYMNNKTYII